MNNGLENCRAVKKKGQIYITWQTSMKIAHQDTWYITDLQNNYEEIMGSCNKLCIWLRHQPWLVALTVVRQNAAEPQVWIQITT